MVTEGARAKMDKPRIIVSMCLLGIACRYDGRSNGCAGLDALIERYSVVPICPEQLGGLPTPRVPSERFGERVIARDGRDMTDAFQVGAARACQIARRLGIRYALLKARSPSCGSGEIYDGTFSGTRIAGDGVTAEALSKLGIRVFDEAHIPELLREMEVDGA
jgi:uncharacterized protein YbbK (DUF523 family)